VIPVPTFATGILEVSDGNEIYWEASGNPDGKPVLYLHGGPGGGLKTGYRRYGDPDAHMVIGTEQRGCGRSRPLVIDALDSLATNTTPALISDIEALRDRLGVESWLVVGVSWGTTLGLAYAQRHPERVNALVLMAVATTTPAEVTWITETIGRVFPEAWQAFHDAGEPRAGERLVDAYARLLTDPDEVVRAEAARNWMAWEDVHISLAPGYQPRFGHDEVWDRCFATLVTHYWSNAGFLGEDEILANMHRIGHIPGVLIHGRHDISGPADIPWTLHRAWPASELVIVESEGHGGPEMAAATTSAVATLSR
jgi:proline iminopeptidase